MRYYKCSKCKRYRLVLMRWRSLTPIGVCTSCDSIRELSTKEIIEMIKRICDYCGSDIPDGTGANLTVDITGPIVGPDGENGVVKAVTVQMEPEICEECKLAFERLFEPDRLKQSIGRLKAVIKKERRAKMSKVSGLKSDALKEAEEERTPTPEPMTV